MGESNRNDENIEITTPDWLLFIYFITINSVQRMVIVGHVKRFGANSLLATGIFDNALLKTYYLPVQI
jgi:hypothetical protein